MYALVCWNSCTNSSPRSGWGCFFICISHMLQISETCIFFVGDLATCMFELVPQHRENTWKCAQSLSGLESVATPLVGKLLRQKLEGFSREQPERH